MFLFPVFLCSFIIPFTEDFVYFVKSILDFLFLLIFELGHTFPGLFLLTVCGVSDHFKTSWIIIQNIYFVLLVLDYLLVQSVKSGWEYLGSCKQTKTLFCENSTINKKLTKKRKLSNQMGLTIMLQPAEITNVPTIPQPEHVIQHSTTDSGSESYMETWSFDRAINKVFRLLPPELCPRPTEEHIPAKPLSGIEHLMESHATPLLVLPQSKLVENTAKFLQNDRHREMWQRLDMLPKFSIFPDTD